MEMAARKVAAAACAAVLACGLGAAGLAAPGTAEAKTVKKPAKVKIKSVKVSKAGKMTVKVAKAKRAKKYQYRVWGAGMRTKTVKTKKRSVSVSVEKAKKTVKVKVRAYNGWKHGKWSSTKTVKVAKVKKAAVGKKAAQKRSAAKPAATAEGGATKGSSGSKAQPARPGKADNGGETDNNEKLQYSYKVRFVHQPTSGHATGVFVDTDNPDSSFTVMLYDKDGNQLGASRPFSFYQGPYVDYSPNELVYTTTDNTVLQWDKVADDTYCGFNGAFYKAAGKTAYVQIWEWNDNGVVKKNIGTVQVRDGSKLYDQWMDAVVRSAVTDRTEPKAQQMQEIRDWLAARSHYSWYVDTESIGRVQFFEEQGLTPWDYYESDAKYSLNCESGAQMLVSFGKKLGYPLKVEHPDPDNTWHADAVAADGTVFELQGDIPAGKVDPSTVKQFDPDTYAGWYDVQAL